MAQFGVSATQLSAPQAGGTIRRPVENTGKVDLLKTVLGTAEEAYTGYQLASLEDAQEGVIDEYMSSKQNPDIMAEAEADLGALESASKSLWDRVAGDAGYQPDVKDFSGVEKALQEKLARFKAAKDQGVMSPQEFADRILATTREAVARNPGLYAELKQHSSRVLELSGITDIVESDMKAQQSAVKQQEDLQKYYLELGKTHKVPVPFGPDGSINWNNFIGTIQTIQQQEQIVNTAKTVGALDDEKRKAQGKIFMDNNGPALMNGRLTQILNQGISIIGEGGDYQGGISQIRLALNAARQEYTQQFSPIANEPAVKSAFEYYDKQAQTIEDILSKAGSKEDAVRLSENMNKLLRNTQYSDLSKYMNPEALKVFTSLMGTVGAPRLIDQNPQAMGEVMKTLGNVFSGVANGMGTDYSAKLGSSNAVSTGIKHIATEAVKDSTVVPVLERALGTIAQDVQNPEKFKAPEDKFRFYESLIRDLGTPEVKLGISKIGSGAYSQAASMIDDYMSMTTPAMMTTINKWEKQGVPVVMDVLPDGRVVFKTQNAEATRDLNSRYSSRINDSLAALSNLMGLDSKSVAATHFYPNYLPAWADDPDIIPLEIKTKEDADKALKDKRITRQEYDGIMNEMVK